MVNQIIEMMLNFKQNVSKHITQANSWKRFAREVRSGGCQLLKELNKFDNSVLVAGCQRSGTTALSRLITTSDGMVNYWFGKDDELDAALILSGVVDHKPRGRYCFQTTYLNECFTEYFNHVHDFKLIWMVRNPFSVIYSMLYNWGRFAFNELFDACGAPLLGGKELRRYERFGQIVVSRLRRACLSYNGKISQIFQLKDKLSDSSIVVVEYDELVEQSNYILPQLYEFIGLDYKSDYGNMLHGGSVNKANHLSQKERRIIQYSCIPVYERAKALSMKR